MGFKMKYGKSAFPFKNSNGKDTMRNIPLPNIEKPKAPTRKHNVEPKERRTGKLQSKKSPMKLAPAVAIQLISAVKDRKKPTKNFFARDKE
jgi:hypothetical protein|tara:strand:+ start:498 stop:770 length:273 start_codon:yes stop_codon:yes gene_type:complete